MPTQKPERPAPGHALLLPRVEGDATQRAFDRVSLGQQQVRAGVDTLTAAVQAIPTSGRRIAEHELTGSGSGTLNALTTLVWVRHVACGGGGGGAGGGANVAAGAGGSSGVYLEYSVTVTPGGAYSWVAPTTGGAAGSSAGGNGGAGSDSTLTLPTATGQATFTAKGGGGGHGLASSTAGFALPVTPAAGSSSGAGIRSTYDIGDPGVVISTAFWFSGSGGTSPFGHGTVGGNDGTGSGAGIDAGPGAGGSGATEKAGGAGKAGGIGGAALIVMWELS